MELWQPAIVIGAACLLAALAAYLRDTSKFIFPVVIALIGAFLTGAQVVKATLPGGGSVELSRQVIDTTQKASATVDASTAASAKQNDVLQQLSSRLDTLQSAIQTLQTELNSRLAATDVAPVMLPQVQSLDASRANLSAALKENFLAQQRLVVKSKELSKAVRSLAAGQ